MSSRDDNDRLRSGDLPLSPFQDAVPIDAGDVEEETTELSTGWPDEPAPEAFGGLAGEFVRIVGPHSEGDPVALLLQFITCFVTVRRTQVVRWRPLAGLEAA